MYNCYCNYPTPRITRDYYDYQLSSLPFPIPPVLAGPYDELPTEYREIGQLIKLNSNLNEKNSVLPLFGREIKNSIFRYYSIYKANNEPFKIYVSKNNRSNNCETSREIYDGDEIYLDEPLNAKYKFKEVRNYY